MGAVIIVIRFNADKIRLHVLFLDAAVLEKGERTGNPLVVLLPGHVEIFIPRLHPYAETDFVRRDLDLGGTRHVDLRRLGHHLREGRCERQRGHGQGE